MPGDLSNAILYSLAIFVLLIILSRLMGRKILSQLSYYDFMVSITIVTITAAFVATQSKGLYILISPIVLTLCVILTGYITLKSVPARKLLEGEPVILVRNGKIYEKNMNKVRYHLDDLLMQLRDKGVFDLGEVEFAILEPDGKLSVLKKSQDLPITPKDLGISTGYRGLPSEVIRSGRILDENLRKNNLTHEWLYNELRSRNIRRIEDVFLGTLSTEGKLYLDLYKDGTEYTGGA